MRNGICHRCSSGAICPSASIAHVLSWWLAPCVGLLYSTDCSDSTLNTCAPACATGALPAPFAAPSASPGSSAAGVAAPYSMLAGSTGSTGSGPLMSIGEGQCEDGHERVLVLVEVSS